MSKNFSIISVVASLVFACSFLAATQVQAEVQLLTTMPAGFDWAEDHLVSNSTSGSAMRQVTLGLNSMATENYKGFGARFYTTDSSGDSFGEFLKESVQFSVTYAGDDSPVLEMPSVPSFPLEATSPGDVGAIPFQYEVFYLWDEGKDFEDATVSYNASILQNITVEIYALVPAAASVPEPATLAVLGLGLLGTGVVASRRRNKK